MLSVRCTRVRPQATAGLHLQLSLTDGGSDDGIPRLYHGIDIGTSSVKAIAFDAMMQALAHAAEQVESWHDDAGATDQDPRIVYQIVMAVLTRTAQESQRLGYTVERVGLSAAITV
jgi:glycerol kinase